MAWLRQWIARYGHQIWVGRGCSVSQPPFTSAIHQKSGRQNARELPKFAMTADESQNSRDRAIHYLGNLITGQ